MNIDFFFQNAWRQKEWLQYNYKLKELEWNHIAGPEELKQSERNPEFERFRINRKIQGAFRYGLFNQKNRPDYDYAKQIKKKAEAYLQTGNDELLIDIANYAELEFTFGKHPLKHFKSEQDINHAKFL